MVLEMAVLKVRSGQGAEFVAAFQEAEPILRAAEGYLSHELRRCVEIADQYLLLVEWRELEDHTHRFRGSAQYQKWKQLLHHFYDPFPTVQHYVSVNL